MSSSNLLTFDEPSNLLSSSNELTRTPVTKISSPTGTSIPFPDLNTVSPAATRSATARAAYKYVEKLGQSPSCTDISGYVVLLASSITSFEGPVWGITGEPVTVKTKSRSQRAGIYVRELYKNTVGETAFVVEKDGLEFVTHARHFADMDNLLFRYGRVIDVDLDQIINVQVVGLDLDSRDIPYGLLVNPRGCDGSSELLLQSKSRLPATS